MNDNMKLTRINQEATTVYEAAAQCIIKITDQIQSEEFTKEEKLETLRLIATLVDQKSAEYKRIREQIALLTPPCSPVFKPMTRRNT
jgi:hypothetical protein